MPDLHKHALVPYSAAKMYEVVNQVDLYSDFLPWCADSRILEVTKYSMTASVMMKKGPLDQTFTTKNKLEPGHQIDLELVDGPFKKLSGRWKFEDLASHGSKVTLTLHYEFSNSIIAMVVGPVFNQIANTLVDSFCKRAEQLYE